MGKYPPQLEASLYGPVGGLLFHYFPVTQGYLVKSQGKVRPLDFDYVGQGMLAAPAQPPGISATTNNTTDSYGHHTLPGTLGVNAPDWLVCKFTRSLHNDEPILVGDGKATEFNMKHKKQLERYMREFRSRGANHVRGFLVCQMRVIAYSFVGDTDVIRKDRGEWALESEKMAKYLTKIKVAFELPETATDHAQKQAQKAEMSRAGW